ncbi:MAG: uncharacterized protein QOF02_97 [Blastocatellia bacterium]|jgi:uncharacterized membrane protein (UPF0182 family)|nr:uncharacterized protein [Blastocatellia bacterium]
MGMNKPTPIDDDEMIIDVSPQPPRRRHWRRWVIVAVLLVAFALIRSLSLYLSARWFGSLGYSSVYWTIFRYKFLVFLVFAVLTVVILRGALLLLERVFAVSTLERRIVMFNNQPVAFAPARFVRPVAWVVSLLYGLIFGLDMKDNWQSFALYLNQPATEGIDPIFQKSVGFYFFSLPVHQSVSWWLTVLAFTILAFTIIYALLTSQQKLKETAANVAKKVTGMNVAQRSGYAAISFAFAVYLLMLAWRTYLARFPYLWQDHDSFAGVTYTEANYLLPGLMIVAVALIISAGLAIFNALTKRGLRLLLAAIALPLAVFIIAVMLVPAYVNSFIVKPNELGRETPYIEHNINWTRKAFALDRIELRDFEADPGVEGLNLEANKATLDNVRLWDWRALQDTLRQIQEIRTYYDFPDVDVDRYRTGGQVRQMMLAARELDVDKLPPSSRNWVNEKLIYTHGYGVTMNTSNGFTPEGMPQFILSNMPLETSAPDIKVTRPEIYYGQKTNTDVYVRTKQKEFNFPQGEANNYTAYEEEGGIVVGGFFSRMLLAWALGDLSKLPFSDDVTPDSRLLMRRNIRDRVKSLAPFLVYDSDPYIVVSDTGRLYWMMDAFTESSNYPYSRHYRAENQNVNYIRNSVKVTVDAYNGSTVFYVFDAQDALIKAYASVFPALFRDAAQMPADLRSHVRYPETLLKTQGEVYGLYHTQNAKVFFQREDQWSVARQAQVASTDKQQQQPDALEPYYVITQLPGEQLAEEFVQILPFTPASRPNMIGWMAGRCDGSAYGSLLVYNFPSSRIINGPAQVEARIEQNAQLSGQFTLWNQQGSRVVRGNLLVIPMGRSLLYIEPIYLRSERSPMPELRLVVVATQERLGYGQNFQEALTNLVAQPAKPSEQKPEEQQQQQQPKPEEVASASTATAPAQGKTPAAPLPQNTQQLINRAADELNAYQRLTAEGKLGEAGQKLESLKRTLEELRKQGAKF